MKSYGELSRELDALWEEGANFVPAGRNRTAILYCGKDGLPVVDGLAYGGAALAGRPFLILYRADGQLLFTADPCEVEAVRARFIDAPAACPYGLRSGGRPLFDELGADAPPSVPGAVDERTLERDGAECLGLDAGGIRVREGDFITGYLEMAMTNLGHIFVPVKGGTAVLVEAGRVLAEGSFKGNIPAAALHAGEVDGRPYAILALYGDNGSRRFSVTFDAEEAAKLRAAVDGNPILCAGVGANAAEKLARNMFTDTPGEYDTCARAALAEM